MSIASEIERLQDAKSALKTAIEGKGVSVPNYTKLDGYANLVDSIEAGGGGTDDDNWYIVCERWQVRFVYTKYNAVWKMDPYNQQLWIIENSPFYFLYKNEKYYATSFATDTKMYLTKTGQPIPFGSLGDIRCIDIRVDTDGTYYAWFELD